MRKLIVPLFIVLSILALSLPVDAFMPWGRIDRHFDYKHFEREGDGYSFTLINKAKKGFSEFYVIIEGYGVGGDMVYRHRFYVDFIPGNSELSKSLPGCDDDIFKVKVKLQENIEVDTRPQN